MRTPMEALAAACAYFGEGGQQKLADALTAVGRPCTTSAISQWRTKLAKGLPFPEDNCEPIEAVTHGAVRCEELRPDLVWRRNARDRVTERGVRLKLTPRPRKPSSHVKTHIHRRLPLVSRRKA